MIEIAMLQVVGVDTPFGPAFARDIDAETEEEALRVARTAWPRVAAHAVAVRDSHGGLGIVATFAAFPECVAEFTRAVRDQHRRAWWERGLALRGRHKNHCEIGWPEAHILGALDAGWLPRSMLDALPVEAAERERAIVAVREGIAAGGSPEEWSRQARGFDVVTRRYREVA